MQVFQSLGHERDDVASLRELSSEELDTVGGANDLKRDMMRVARGAKPGKHWEWTLQRYCSQGMDWACES